MNVRESKLQFGFTLIELLVIIVTVVMLIVLVFSGARRVKEDALRKQCVDNLKQVGLAFRQWGSHKGPMQTPNEWGGAQQSVTNGEMFRVFQVMSNELYSPKILVCPSDIRIAAAEFVTALANTNISYFLGLDAQDTFPQMFLSGDRNLEIDGVAAGPGVFALTTANNLSWTRTIHDRIGNVGLADGSVQHFDKKRLNEALAVTGAVTNRLVFP